MFRPMRRKAKEISTEAAKRLLCNERRGVFAVNGDDGYPYAIPVILKLGVAFSGKQLSIRSVE